MLAWVAFGNAREDSVADGAPYRALHGAASPEEEKQLAQLLAESYAVLRSPELQANLRALSERYPAIYENNGQQRATLADVAALVAVERWGSRYVQADVYLIGAEQQPGSFLGATSEGAAGEGRYSDILLRREVLAAFGSPDVVVRSCAVNVAAHELSHTISTTPFVYRTAFTDTNERQSQINGRRDRSTPVASYLVGTVAQCSWLQMRGRIGAGEVAACVEVFGVAAGNDQRCGQFRNGEPVALRPGLAPANPPL